MRLRFLDMEGLRYESEERGGSSEQTGAVGAKTPDAREASGQLQTHHNHRQDTNTQAGTSGGHCNLCCSFGCEAIATVVRAGGRLFMVNSASVDKKILRLFPDFSSPRGAGLPKRLN
jgi:hypothetical protein